jgi:hypothetical protein
MIYRGPCFLAIVWFFYFPPPPLSKFDWRGDTQAGWERETTCWGDGEELNLTTARNPGPLLTIQYSQTEPMPPTIEILANSEGGVASGHWLAMYRQLWEPASIIDHFVCTMNSSPSPRQNENRNIPDCVWYFYLAHGWPYVRSGHGG